MRRILLCTCTLVSLSSSAFASDCLPWQVGFDFASCTREGSEAEAVQVYAMPDGSVRRLTEDPGVPQSAEGAGSSLLSQAIAAVRDDLTSAGAPPTNDLPEPGAQKQGDQPPEPGVVLMEETGPATEEGVSRVAVEGPAEAPEAELERMRSGLVLEAPETVPGQGGPIEPSLPFASSGDVSPPQGDPLDQAAPTALQPDVTTLDLPTELPGKVMSTPGQTVMLQMSVGHLNRIETPFSQPVIKTSQPPEVLKTEFEENFVYVTLTQPSTLFVHENGHPDPVIAVSLIPMKILPRQVKIELPADVMARVERQRPPQAPTAAELASSMQFVEESKPETKGPDRRPSAKPEANSNGVRRTAPDGPPNYNNTSYFSATLLRTFSTGRIPGGFFEGSIEGFSASSFCGGVSGATFTFDDGRMIYSADMVIVRGRVSASSRVQLDERTCNRHRGTIAVAFSPKTLIGPDNPTDFYIVLSRAEVEKRG